MEFMSVKLYAEAKEEFDGNCSVGVYSVQACIPNDPAALWNAEFVQAEKFFKQAPMVENCLRDNRYISFCFTHINKRYALFFLNIKSMKFQCLYCIATLQV